jgi:hypothetical protein
MALSLIWKRSVCLSVYLPACLPACLSDCQQLNSALYFREIQYSKREIHANWLNDIHTWRRVYISTLALCISGQIFPHASSNATRLMYHIKISAEKLHKYLNCIHFVSPCCRQFNVFKITFPPSFSPSPLLLFAFCINDALPTSVTCFHLSIQSTYFPISFHNLLNNLLNYISSIITARRQWHSSGSYPMNSYCVEPVSFSGQDLLWAGLALSRLDRFDAIGPRAYEGPALMGELK